MSTPTMPLQEITEKARKISQESDISSVFLTRVFKAAIAYVESTMETKPLINAVTASSDYEVLLKILESPEALALLKKNDPLVQAKLRGLEIKQKLIEAEGGCISSIKVAEILGISRQAVDKRRKQGQLLAIAEGKHRYLYPIWQFSNEGTVLFGLESVLQELKDYDSWTQLSFLLDPNSSFGEKTPLNALREGKIEEVIQVTRCFGEHSAI